MLPRAREEGRGLLGGLLDGLGLDREVHREGAPDVLGEGDDEELEVLGGDIELNAQGLAVWLDKVDAAPR